jgi:hypothetical protein
MTRYDTFQTWQPDGRPVRVRDEVGDDKVRLRHTQPRPDKEVGRIDSVTVDRIDLAARYPALAIRLAAEEAVGTSCGHSQRAKAEALGALAEGGDNAARALMAIGSSRPSTQTDEERVGAIEALHRFGTAEVVDRISALAGDVRESLAVRCAALRTLGAFGSEGAIRTLETHLRAGPVAIRRSAARGLAGGPASSITALERAVEDDLDPRVARQAWVAITSIERREGQEFSRVRVPRAPGRRVVRRDADADALTEGRRDRRRRK